MALSIQDAIGQVRSMPTFGRFLAMALQKIEDAVNHSASDIGVNPTGTLPPPPPVQGLNVKVSSDGFAHVAITDANPISRNLQYFVEYDTSPAFSQPQVIPLGASRNHVPFKLPATDDHSNPQTYYFRAYSQYPDSEPGKKVNFGGTAPTAVNPGGSTQMTLLPSTGSGTASATGTQGGSGLGTVLNRPPIGPKRVTTPTREEVTL